MTAWTIQDIKQAILAAQPKGWKTLFEEERGIFTISFTDEGGEIVWVREGIDERVVLFDAFGWLQQRQLPRSNPVWVRRQNEICRPRVGPMSLPGVHVPDPADLDPAEIDMVYREHLSRRK